VRHLAGISEHPPVAPNTAQEPVSVYEPGGYVLGRASDYNRDVALDVAKLLAFLQATQPKAVETLESGQRGHQAHAVPAPAARRDRQARRGGRVAQGREPRAGDGRSLQAAAHAGQRRCREAFAKNIFSVTRQVRYSNDSGNELDLVVFINGLPVLTFELKNSLTKQTVADAIVQYQTTRDPEGAAVPVRSLRGAHGGGRRRGALLHRIEGQGLVVPAVQPGLEQRRGQPAQPERHQNRLPVEAGAGEGVAGQHHRELRTGGGGRGRRRQRQAAQDPQAGVSALSPVAHSACPAAPRARRMGSASVI
jgi:hypothetical protein